MFFVLSAGGVVKDNKQPFPDSVHVFVSVLCRYTRTLDRSHCGRKEGTCTAVKGDVCWQSLTLVDFHLSLQQHHRCATDAFVAWWIFCSLVNSTIKKKLCWSMVSLYDISFLMCWKPFPTKQVKHNGAHKHMLKVHELIHENRKAKRNSLH